jgi:hypothetical protein
MCNHVWPVGVPASVMGALAPSAGTPNTSLARRPPWRHHLPPLLGPLVSSGLSVDPPACSVHPSRAPVCIGSFMSMPVPRLTLANPIALAPALAPRSLLVYNRCSWPTPITIVAIGRRSALVSTPCVAIGGRYFPRVVNRHRMTTRGKLGFR